MSLSTDDRSLRADVLLFLHVGQDDRDGNGLQLKKIGSFFHVLLLCLEKSIKIVTSWI